MGAAIVAFRQEEAASAKSLMSRYTERISGTIEDAISLGVRLGVELGRRNLEAHPQALVEQALTALRTEGAL